jgi:signal transduction histidine kinase
MLRAVQAVTSDLQAQVRELEDLNREYAASVALLEDTHEQLLQAGKMAALGSLIAGLSHELNNPLGIISGYVQSMLKLIPAGGPLHTPLLAIGRQAERCTKLVRGLLDYTRHHRDAGREIVAAPSLLAKAQALVEETARRASVRIAIDATSTDEVELCVQEIETVLLNMMSNAIDACSAGGTVTVGVRSLSKEHQPGVEYSVRDDGCGMDAATIPRIFDPFFTTKPPDRGTGLGLSLSREIIDRHMGTVNVESAKGRGTTMRFWLPLRRS